MQELLIPEGNNTYAYNATTGNVANILAPDSTMSFVYDGSLLSETTWSGTVSGSVSRTYNDDFMIESQSVNNGNTINYGYDDDGLLISVGSLALNRDPQSGMLTGTNIGNVSDSISYNDFGEIESYQATYNGSTVFETQYQTDKLGRITSKTEIVNGETHTYSYTYDLTGQLTDVYKDGALVSHYDYDANGNRTRYTGADGTFNGTYDDQDRMLSYGGNIYQYTANGELKSKTDATGTTQYDYDVLGNLRAVILPDGTKLEYVIDGQNRRIGKKVNGALVQGFLYQDALNPVAELDASGNLVSRFIYGIRDNVPDYMIKGGVKYRIISDHLGSVRLVVNAYTGDIVQKMEYDEFGKVITDTNLGFQPFGFAGGLYDKDTGLVRFGARDYDAETGRWTAKDPIKFKGGNPNLFGYVINNPVNSIDISGLLIHNPADPVSLITYAIFLKNYKDMRDANTIGADKYFHCKANCQAAKLLGIEGYIDSIAVSEARELVDEHLKGDPKNACDADKYANQVGRKGGLFSNIPCTEVCSQFRPNGLDPKY